MGIWGKFRLAEPTYVLIPPRFPVPVTGTIPRCPHHNYAPDDGKAFSCRSCYPACPVLQRNVVLPRRHLKDSDALYANKNNRGHCPRCSSAVHSVEPDGRRRCEEIGCGRVYGDPRKPLHTENVQAVTA